MLSPISSQLLAWYGPNQRKMPWRGHPDPYAVWVSEIMLQQTRVDTVTGYFERWMTHFPDIQALASASQQDVLTQWEGLGYYARARSLHRAAQIVVNQLGGQIPANQESLRKLPGVGRYTAAAIASIAFNQDVPTLDGNIRRVLARLFNLEIPARSPAGEEQLWKLAADHLPPGRAGDYNQAWMDLGSQICTPRQPACNRCPLIEFCQACQLGVQHLRPVLPEPKKTPHYIVTAAVIEQAGLFLLARRPEAGLLGGLWEFPGGKMQPGEDLSTCLKREICEELGAEIEVGASCGVYRHAFTHFKITLHAFRCRLLPGNQPQALEASALNWTSPADLESFPMGKVDRQIAARLQSETRALSTPSST